MKQNEKVRQENLLMFTGAALMCAGPAFWFAMQWVLSQWLPEISARTAGLVSYFDMGGMLLLVLTGAALATAGWSLSAWHAWREVKSSGVVHEEVSQ